MQKSVLLPALSLALAGAAAAQPPPPAPTPTTTPTTVSAVAASPQSRPTRLLSDFGGATEIARFARVGIDAARFTPTDGGGARLVFEKYSPGRAEWPALILRANKGMPGNWSDYDILAVDVRNDSAAAADLAFLVADTGSTSITRHYTIPAGKTETLRFPLAEMGKVTLTRVREMHLFATRPAVETTLVLKDLRLVSDPAARRAALDATIAAVNATYARLLAETKDPDVRELIRGEQRTGRDLQERLRAAGDRAAQTALRSELVTGEQRLLQIVPRRVSENRLRREFAGIDRKAPYAVGFATGMEKVFPADLPFQAKVTREARLSVAGNETESLQLLVLADKQELKDVRVTVGDLTQSDGLAKLPSSAVTAAPVGFVLTKRPGYKVNYVGWHPDPILDFMDKVTVRAGEMQPIWLRVAAPAGTPPGDYKGTITVRPANAAPVTLKLTVTVWGFSLPDETHLRTAVSFRDPMLKQVYGNDSAVMRQRYLRFLLRYRINPDDIYRYTPPNVSDLALWNREGMNAFNLTYVVKPADLKPGAPYPAERKAEILAQLDAIIPDLKARGLYKKAYVYGFDEVSEGSFAAMKDVLGAIKAKYPDLLILTTAYDATYGKTSGLPVSIVDGWVPLTPRYDLKRVAEARREGKQVWWYTCIVPQSPYANWLIEYDAIEARSLMGLQTAKYKPDGFLYYAVNRWPLSKKPITGGPYTDWPAASFNAENGDGSILCAGPDGPLPTIRLENIRDGIEDNEYFWLLEQEITKLRASRRPEAAAALRQALAAQAIGDDLVRDLSHFSKSPDAIYAKRRQVAEAILAARAVTQ
jgi:hypothetical protein